MNKNKSNSAFVIVPGRAPVLPPRTSSSPYLANSKVSPNISGSSILNAVAQSKQAWDGLPPNVKEAVKNKVSEVVTNKTKDPTFNMDSNNNSSGYSLTKSPQPKMISLDTGIKPNTYSSDYLEAVENACAPLHITHAKFQLPVVTTTQLYNYFRNVIGFDIQTKAQVNVSFNLDLNVFSADNILLTMNAVANAFQVYFYYASIISYHSNPENKNGGMIYLRNQITAQAIEDLTQLGRILQDTPVPPKMYELIRYLSGNFLSGTSPESPIIMISPSVPTNNGINLSDIGAAYTALQGASVKPILTLLRRAVPQWRNPTLYDVETVPLYDRNFLTIFANLPFTYFASATFTRYPSVSLSTTPIKYNSFTTELDGTAFALNGIWNTTEVAWSPGLMISTGVTGAISGNSRTSYYQVGGVTKMYPSDLDPFLTRSRSTTYMLNDALTLILSPHIPGTSMCEGVTINTIRETCMNVLDYLMSADTIKIDVRKFHFGSSLKSDIPDGKPKFSRRKRN